MTKKKFWDNSSLQEEIHWDNQQLPGLTDEELYSTNWTRKTAMNQVNKNRPAEVHIKKSETIKKQYSDPAYKKIRKEIIQQVTSTVEWKDRHKQGILKRELNGWAEKNQAARKTKQIQTPYGLFNSKKAAVEAMSQLGIVNAYGKLSDWLNTKSDEYFYVDK